MSNEHFNLIAGIYNKVAEFSYGSRLAELLTLPAEGRLLDIGGGTGRVANALRSLVDQVLVVDVARRMLEFAVEKDLECVQAPVELLPFGNATFTRIVMLDALHHVQDQKKAALELFRILAAGGRLLIIEPDIRKFGVKMIALAEKVLLMRSRFLNGARMAALFMNTSAKITLQYENNYCILLIEKE